MTSLIHKSCGNPIYFDCDNIFKITSEINLRGGKVYIGPCEVVIKAKNSKPKFTCIPCKEEVEISDVQSFCVRCMEKFKLDDLYVINDGNKISSVPLCKTCMEKDGKKEYMVKIITFFNKIYYQSEVR
jgi:hypothetical protein